ncbi:glycosyltransferase family 2 protein [Candidatus Micrarchaeota archaeon]|nr:glycosyltransferase family 2 protein [Candidatus Micrarchaeota archaeon]
MTSNRPKNAAKTLQAYGKVSWILVCPERFRADMKTAAKDADVTVVTEEAFLNEMPRRLHAPFAKGFGGWRNMALAFCSKEKKDVVFLDDDTTPQNNVLERFDALMPEKGMVLGKYGHHVGGASTALLDLTHALEKFNQKKLREKEFLRRLEERLQGVPPEQRPVQGAGAVGGCLGISAATAQNQCFFPSVYRVEDGTYAALCAGNVVQPSMEEAPMVRHEKEGRPDGLRSELQSDLDGNVVAAYVVAREKNEPMAWDDLKKRIRKGLLVDYFQEKYAKTEFRHPDLDRIAQLQVRVSEAQADDACTSYRDAQAIWLEAWETA